MRITRNPYNDTMVKSKHEVQPMRLHKYEAWDVISRVLRL